MGFSACQAENWAGEIKCREGPDRVSSAAWEGSVGTLMKGGGENARLEEGADRFESVGDTT